MPETKNDRIDAAKADADKHAALEAVANTEGGKILIQEAIDDINVAMGVLTTNYAEMPEFELRATCAKLAAATEIYNKLTAAPAKKAFALEELKKAGG